MNQNNQSAFCITVNLLSFSIPQKIICETDQVQVKIKTMPDGNKQKFDIKGKKMSNCNLISSFNITDQTKKLHIIFRKKTILSGKPIVGNAFLDIEGIIKSPANESSSGIKILDIYYPIERQLQEKQQKGSGRSSFTEKVIGQAKIAISLSEPHDFDQNDSKNIDQKKQATVGSYSDNLL